MQKTVYTAGRLPNLFAAIAVKFNIEPNYLKSWLLQTFPQLGRKEYCANCDASMEQYIYTLDCLDALLVYGMAKRVKEKELKGMSRAEANAVHIQSELATYYSVKSRSTQCAALGYIDMVRKPDGVHDTKKGWYITDFGWDLLAGKSVRAKVKTWRKKPIERYETYMTITEAFQAHRDLIARMQARGKSPENDYTTELDTYNPADWYERAGAHAGRLL